jgi:hypothetical protein
MSETILIVADEHRQPGEAYPVAVSAREWFPPFSGQPIAPRLPRTLREVRIHVLRQSFRTPGVGHPLFSRRLLNRAWWIAGASDDNDDLRLKIRDRLIKGTLFPPPGRIWAGSGTGRLCVICGTTISSREVECEMTLGPVTLWAHHLPCHALWREESARLDLARHEEARASDRESASP